MNSPAFVQRHAVGRDQPSRRLRHVAHAVFKGMRPRQWIKNLLVFAAPGTAGMLSHLSVLAHASAAFCVFCVVSSATYLINDSFDVDADRNHPQKKLRPVASGKLGVGQARMFGGALFAVGIPASFFIAGWPLGLVVAGYALISFAYCTLLKHIPVIDLFAIASGFLLRALAGGVATGVKLSGWFLIVTAFGSMFVVAGKRQAELTELGPTGVFHRVTLNVYTRVFLRRARYLSATIAVVGAFFWALHRAVGAKWGGVLFGLSLLPMVVAMVRYEMLLSGGRASAPEELFLTDRVLQLTTCSWVALVATATYGT